MALGDPLSLITSIGLPTINLLLSIIVVLVLFSSTSSQACI